MANARIASTSNSNPITNKREMDVSSKLKSNSGVAPQATSTQPETGEVSVGNSARTEEIRRRAYEIYLERGKQSGRDVDDWLQAEQEFERGDEALRSIEK
jgi:cytoskeletal protein RodZ